MELFLTICDWMAFLSGLIGAPLGWIEYFYPALANKIEDAIDNAQHQFENWGDKFTSSHLFETLLTLSIPCILVLLYFPISYYAPTLDTIRLGVVGWTLLGLIVIPTIGGLLLYLMAWLIEVLNKATGGHALGTIGLILIVVGLVGDVLDKVLSALIM